MGKRFLACALCLLGWSASSRAQAPAEAPSMSMRLSADPNAAAYGIEYRGAVRGRFGDVFELYGGPERPGYRLALAPLFELHEPRRSKNILPSQYWRARVSLEQSYGWNLPALHVRIGALLTHESDHETAHAYSRPGFLALNDVAARVLVGGRQLRWAWYAAVDAQLYFLSCTQPSRVCENFHGDSSVGGQAQAGLALPGLSRYRFAPFVAASVTGIAAHGIVEAERRLLARMGLYAELGESLVTLFVVGSLGNDVGIVRNRTLNVIGAGISFSR